MEKIKKGEFFLTVEGKDSNINVVLDTSGDFVENTRKRRMLGISAADASIELMTRIGLSTETPLTIDLDKLTNILSEDLSWVTYTGTNVELGSSPLHGHISKTTNKDLQRLLAIAFDVRRVYSDIDPETDYLIN